MGPGILTTFPASQGLPLPSATCTRFVVGPQPWPTNDLRPQSSPSHLIASHSELSVFSLGFLGVAPPTVSHSSYGGKHHPTAATTFVLHAAGTMGGAQFLISLVEGEGVIARSKVVLQQAEIRIVD